MIKDKDKVLKLEGVGSEYTLEDVIRIGAWQAVGTDKQGNPYKQIFVDYDGSLSINLGVYGIPETLLINNKKIVLLKFIGALNSQKYQKIIDAINNEK